MVLGIGNLDAYGGRIGVRHIGSYFDSDSGLRGSVNRYDVKNIRFQNDSITNCKTLKWNDEAVVREYLDGPKSLTPRFGVEGDFFLTDRIKSKNVVAGKINKAGDIVELSKLDINAVKEMQKDFPYVERFLRKISKFILR